MAMIRKITKIPGPKSIDLIARKDAAVPRGAHQVAPIVIRSAHGALADDVDGNTLIDFAGGIGVMNVGHSNPSILSGVREQLERLTHICFAVASYTEYIDVAERLARLTPGDFPKKTLFVNTGAEAVENAVKIARHATKRSAILCFEDAFHGRTLTALALTSKVQPYKAGMGPFDTSIVRVPYGYCYRCSYKLSYPSCNVSCVDQIETYFSRYIEPQSVAAVIVEPVLGEGGFVVPPREYLPKLGALCRKYGILTIADEIQTGIGRTGKMFACEHSDFVPDLLLTSKSLAAGLPLAAVIGRAEIMDSPIPGGLGGTFGGNPLALAAARAVLEVIERDGLLDRAKSIGDRIEARAQQWAMRYPFVGDVRRLGAMVGVELVRDRETREPARSETTEIISDALAHGLIVLPAGTYGNILRFLPPLVISEHALDEGLDVLSASFEHVYSRHATQCAANSVTVG